MSAMFVPAIVAVGVIAGCSLALVRRSGSSHMKWVLVTISLMAVTQGAMMAASVFGASTVVVQLLQLLLAGLSLHVLYLLGTELYARNVVDRNTGKAATSALESIAALGNLQLPAMKKGPANASRVVANTPTDVGELHTNTLRATADLLLLLGALTEGSGAPTPAETMKKYLTASRGKNESVARS